jgi:hypothetical protein
MYQASGGHKVEGKDTLSCGQVLMPAAEMLSAEDVICRPDSSKWKSVLASDAVVGKFAGYP